MTTTRKTPATSPRRAERKQTYLGTDPASKNRKRLAAAIMELLTNPETPERLEDVLFDFLCEADSGNLRSLYTKVPGGLQAIERLLAFVNYKEMEASNATK